ncbi:MAG: C45 family peptidase [Chlamydiales bacterium]|nr:C45 family peptidase [Chlamydiales bacterium]
MLYLDYTLPRSSLYMLFIDMPFRYSWRHLIQYFNSRIIQKQIGIETLSKKERIWHFAFAFFEVLPVLGFLVAIIDRMLFFKKSSTQLASNLLETMVPLYCKVFGNDAVSQSQKQQAYILPRYMDEMKKLAHDTGYEFSDILLANTILDRVSLFGGSIKASCGDTKKVATSYFHSHGRGADVVDVDKSFWRFDTLQNTTASNKQALLAVNTRQTLASCIYDGKNSCLYYAIGSDHSANRCYHRYKLDIAPNNITVLHNIDIPMGLLSPYTRLFTHEKTATTYGFVAIGWHGIVGCYFGINEHGLSVSGCSVPGKSQPGVPNHLLIRQILEEAKTTLDAKKIIDIAKPSASMNLLIAASDGIVRIEVLRH